MGEFDEISYSKASKNTTQLAELSKEVAPRLYLSDAGTKNDSKVIPFGSIYQAFNVQTRSPGYLYALATNYSTDTELNVYKSINGGVNWEVMGTIAYNAGAGERLEKIFVVPYNENVIILKNDGRGNRSVLTFDKTLFLLGTLSIGARTWHSNYHNIDSRNQYVIMAEYANTLTLSTCKLWYSQDGGETWTDRTVGVPENVCRHFHCVQADPYNAATYWMGSGDADTNCKIWKSTDYGYSWTLVGGGSQEFRTLGFVFTSDYIYWAMDNEAANVPTKIFKSSRTDVLAREVVGLADNNLPIYGITRTFYPPGFLIFPDHEPTSTYDSHLRVEFFNLASEELKTVAKLPIFSKTASEYYGFNAASRYQCRTTGIITAELASLGNLDQYLMAGGETKGMLVGKLSC